MVGNPHLAPAVAADDDVVAGLDTNDADILDRRLGAIARAAGDRELDLVRGPRAPAHLLDLDAEPGRILRAKAAPFAADAGLYRAQPLGIGVAGHQPGPVQIAPDARQLLLFDAEQVDALAAGDLDRRDRIFFCGVGDRAQFLRVGQPAPHPRHDRKRAVLLDVGVDPLVDKARLRIVAVAVGPGADQVVVQRRPAFLAAV